MQAELYLLQDDVESAGTELNNVESLFNQDRDVEAVEMSRLLGLLAEGLALWPDAQAHYLAGQAKLAVLCELFGSQVRYVFRAHHLQDHPLTSVQPIKIRLLKDPTKDACCLVETSRYGRNYSTVGFHCAHQGHDPVGSAPTSFGGYACTTLVRCVRICRRRGQSE